MRKVGDLRKRSKRGQNLTLGTVILIVLGIAVLVFLIYGFSTGWSNLWSRVTAFTNPDSNVDTVKQACELACSTNGVSAYCSQKRVVNLAEGYSNSTLTCKGLEGTNLSFTKKDGSSKLENNLVPPCSTVTCPSA